ncbi:cephalosporin hydroxylase family protein [Stutzerimonas zhaodongensis]|jgi:cephalosporin hydroxylase|uniref:cephalosporin hydroxylase family protein n=1 Tax=Stutzerimonas zhaodongensis TaxID=1176257 RepID=UPI002739C6E0|nr:cephalosporin hydroxylase family protein [Stutzerimonas zhaodongensis]
MDMVERFFAESRARIHSYPRSKVEADAAAFMVSSIEAMYSYNYTSLGRPIIQYPQDMIAMQEIIWAVKPDLIIETGIAHGGSLIMYASALALIDYAEAVELGRTLDPNATKRRVLGIDIDIRAHNRAAIEAHPMSHRIEMIQGSSIDSEIISRVHEYSKGYEKVMVVLDSNHTHNHVLAELEAYGSLVSKGSYCVVFDTVVEDLPSGMYKDRPWDKGNNPKTAVIEYLRRLEEIGARDAGGFPVSYEVDRSVEDKLLITVAPHGYLRRV